MTALAALLTLSLAFPQDKEAQKADPRFTSILSASEQKQLNGKMRAWFDAAIDLDSETATGPKRDELRRKERLALEALVKDWEKVAPLDKKGDLLKHLGDMRAILKNAVPYKSQTGSGEVKSLKPKEGSAYHVVVPKTYQDTNSYRTIMLVTGLDAEKKAFAGAKEWFDKTWRGSELADSTLFVIPTLDGGLDHEPIPDPGSEADQKTENDRMNPVRAALGNANSDYRLDPERLLLDGGKGTSAMLLRLCTYFPHRFAGIILRHPVEVDKLHLENLTGLPVLLLSSDETKAACEKLEKTLNGFQAGACKVIEGKGGYPFADSKADIAQWAKDVQRDLFRPKVSLVPTHNAWNDGYWVILDRCDPIESTTEAERPMLTAEADAKENRITINCRGVSSYVLRLNDALVDLDKEVTIVTNGVAEKLKPQRLLLKAMCEPMQKFRDVSPLFTARYAKQVPPPEKKPAKSEEEKTK